MMGPTKSGMLVESIAKRSEKILLSSSDGGGDGENTTASTTTADAAATEHSSSSSSSFSLIDAPGVADSTATTSAPPPPPPPPPIVRPVQQLFAAAVYPERIQQQQRQAQATATAAAKGITIQTLHSSPTLNTNAESSASTTVNSLRGFFRKTVDNTATTATTLWKQRLEQKQQAATLSSSFTNRNATASTGGLFGISTSSTTIGSLSGGAPTTTTKQQPLINLTQLDQASLSPASIDHHDRRELQHEEKEEYKQQQRNVTAEKNDDSNKDYADDNTGEEEGDDPPLYGNRNRSTSHDSSASATGESGSPRGRGGSSFDDTDEDDEETYDMEETNSSVYSTSYYSSEAGGGNNKFSALQWAAASVVDSVQSGYFRGRYANGVPSFSSSSKASILNIGGGRGVGTSSGILTAASAVLVGSPDGGVGGTGSTTSTPRGSNHSRGGGASVVSQTTKILNNSAHAGHVQEMLDKLSSPNEYIMFLGKGMLGVNLKQSYLQKIGVYVDYLIQYGAAERSHLIHIGDLLVQVGHINVRNQTILNIPQQIAAAKRPLHLIWATGLLHPGGASHLNFVELAVAHMQRWGDHDVSNHDHDVHDCGVSTSSSGGGSHSLLNSFGNNNNNSILATGSSSLPSTPGREGSSVMMQRQRHSSDADAAAVAAVISSCGTVEAAATESQEEAFASPRVDEQKRHNEPSLFDDNEDSKNDDDDDHLENQSQGGGGDSHLEQQQQQHPVVEIPAVGSHSMDAFCNPGVPPLPARQAYYTLSACRNRGFSVLQLCQNAATDENFRNLLQYAFMLCAMDDRRFVFLSRHMSQQEKEEDDTNDQLDNSNNSSSSRPYNSPSALLMLYVEMITFADLYGVTPQPRIRQIANRIAYKFFLPTRLGNELVPPMFDFHQIVPDSTLRALEARLKETDSIVSRDLFVDFCAAAMESLASHPFITFLVSAECARMRAYLRNTAIFVNVPLQHVFDATTNTTTGGDDLSSKSLVTTTTTKMHAQNHFCFILMYLLCQSDKEGYGENNDLLSTGNGARCEDSAGSLCCALFIRRQLVAAVRQLQFCCQDDCNDNSKEARRQSSRALILAWERLWEIFLAPHVGALALAPLSNEASAYLSTLVSHLDEIHRTISIGGAIVQGELEGSDLIIAERLCDDNLLKSALMLADELIYEYAVTIHSKFREHKFHEWLCSEFANAREDNEEETTTSSSGRVPRLPEGCVKRLLRRATIPVGIAPHKPFVRSDYSFEEREGATTLASCAEEVNAECAVVFGTRVGLFDSNPALTIDDHHNTGNENPLRRYACEPLYFSQDCSLSGAALKLEDIPPTLEGFAVVPTAAESSPGPFRQYRDGQWISSDGWEVAIVNFRIPRGDSSEEHQDSFLFGVSLVLRTAISTAAVVPNDGRTELVYDQGLDSVGEVCPVSVAKQPDDSLITQVRVGIETPIFNEKLAEKPWTERIEMGSASQATVGLVLLSHQNVILAMRETLVKLLKAFSGDSSLTCSALADVLGNFAHEEVEAGVLHAILGSFLSQAAHPWLERPIVSQKHEFEQLAGRHLIQSLPPIPLALLFVTAILEQKIVFASSRRSLLLSVSVALTKMLRPLSWCHLLVPRVPSALAADLIQYPAPFILGIPSEDPGMMDLIRDLPDDVTLVDLDIGRVLLAQSFSHIEFGRGTPNNPKTTRALRSQLLYLAQSLGGLFGCVSDPGTWSCDRPFSGGDSMLDSSQFDKVCAVCHDFLDELLAGTPACCYWLEEVSCSADSKQEPTVLFDEDRFFHIKSMRQRHGFQPLFDPAGKASRPSMALSLTDFELVLEVLMRCQSMNAYIASCDKDTMAYCIHH